LPAIIFHSQTLLSPRGSGARGHLCLKPADVDLRGPLAWVTGQRGAEKRQNVLRMPLTYGEKQTVSSACPLRLDPGKSVCRNHIQQDAFESRSICICCFKVAFFIFKWYFIMT